MKRQKLKEWTEEWVQYKKKYVKESTYATYLTLLENQILPRLGDVVIEDIDSQVIQEQVSYWCENGRIDKSGGLSQKTIKDMVTILKMCIRDYAKMNHYNVPVLEVEYPTSRQTQRKEILTKEQQDYLIGIIKNNLEYETLGYALLMYTGIRVGDADGKISLNQQKPSKHAGLRRFGPEKFLQRNNEFMKERPIFYKKPIKTEKDFSTWLRCFYYTTKAVITEYIYF